MVEPTPILISLKTFSGQGMSALRWPLQRLSKEYKITALSSVYKVNRLAESWGSLRDLRKEERLNGVTMVVRATTIKSAVEVLRDLEAIELGPQPTESKRNTSMNLLVYGMEVLILPKSSLPHPEMHLHPEEIVPAVEVWADYVHPVLGEPLIKISRKFAATDWGEFLAQGQALLDF